MSPFPHSCPSCVLIVDVAEHIHEGQTSPVSEPRLASRGQELFVAQTGAARVNSEVAGGRSAPPRRPSTSYETSPAHVSKLATLQVRPSRRGRPSVHSARSLLPPCSSDLTPPADTSGLRPDAIVHGPRVRSARWHPAQCIRPHAAAARHACYPARAGT